MEDNRHSGFTALLLVPALFFSATAGAGNPAENQTQKTEQTPDGLTKLEWGNITQQVQKSRKSARLQAEIKNSSDQLTASAPTIVPDFQQNAYLKASNTNVGDYFGWSVAISGNTLVVGARFEDSNATGVNGDDTNISVASSGAAYFYQLDRVFKDSIEDF